MDGILLIDKPSGPTSFDVVRAVRKRAGQRKVGHAGTLDPLASGLLVVCLGQGTKLVPYLMDGDKRYSVRVALGEETDTLDSEGTVTKTAPVPEVSPEVLQSVIEPFLGVISQVPPKYSAIKQNGVALHKRVRRGEEVEVSPRNVSIQSIDVVELGPSDMTLDVRCGKGTYVRSLARDISLALGTVGHVTYLRRMASSGFTVEDAVTLETVAEGIEGIVDRLLPVPEGVRSLHKHILSDTQETAARVGRSLVVADDPRLESIPDGQTVALLSGAGALVCVAERRGDVLKTVRGFN